MSLRGAAPLLATASFAAALGCEASRARPSAQPGSNVIELTGPLYQPPSRVPGQDELGPFRTTPPTIVPTPKIPLAVPLTPFVDAGCKAIDGGAKLDCTHAAGFAPGACPHGVRRNDALAGLGQRLPIYECLSSAERPAPGLFHFGGLADVVLAFLVVENRTVTVVNSEAELIRRFAPADTPETALGLAAALTSGHPEFEPKAPGAGYHVYVKSIEGTRVVPSGDGWDVNLFSARPFGCGRHPVIELDVHVTRDGVVTLTRARDLYSDPVAGVCAD
jgi:hypothetical protein